MGHSLWDCVSFMETLLAVMYEVEIAMEIAGMNKQIKQQLAKVRTNGQPVFLP